MLDRYNQAMLADSLEVAWIWLQQGFNFYKNSVISWGKGASYFEKKHQ